MTSRCIILAEDDAGLRASSALLLQRDCGKAVNVQTAASRGEALMLLSATSAEETPIIIVDLRMPVRGDGEAIAQAALEKGIQVIIFSGTLDDLSAEVKAKCRAVIDKSSGLSIVGEQVKLCLSGH